MVMNGLNDQILLVTMFAVLSDKQDEQTAAMGSSLALGQHKGLCEYVCVDNWQTGKGTYFFDLFLFCLFFVITIK